MEFYFVTQKYVEYLQKIQPNIMNPTDITYVRKKFVVGVVLQINGYEYYVPLSSIKNKQLQDTMTLSQEYAPTCFPIINKHNGRYVISATLRMSYMFPVPKNETDKLVIMRLPKNHQILVQRQYKYVIKHSADIQQFAENIYNAACNKLDNIHKHCCNFKDLEAAHDYWIKDHMVSKPAPVKQPRL